MRKMALIAATSVVLSVTSCTYMSQGLMAPEDRGAVAVAEDYFGDSSKEIVYLEQNWDATDSLWFYNTTQGSNMMPYDIFLHLEQATSQESFRAEDNMRRFRYLTQNPTWDNPDGLPVGLVKDTFKDKDYVGFTCAACHTNQVNYRGVGIRIDGGPAMADMEGMLTALSGALASTLEDEAKFERLAKNVLKANYLEQKETFRQTLKATFDQRDDYNRINTPSLEAGGQVHYGYARLDAFGRIFNRVFEHLTPAEDNFNPANAPVSYPFLWDTPQHDFVQWNGVGDNADIGPLGRNTGEVLGVFGTFDLDRKKGDIGYRSSVNARNLVRIERHLQSLESPVWPQDILPVIDEALAEQGKQVFVEYRCHSCHEAIDRSDDKRLVTAQFSSIDLIGTDPVMGTNALSRQGKSGYFDGQPVSVLKPKGDKVGAEVGAVVALTKAAEGVILEPDHDKLFFHRWFDELYDLTVAFFDNPVKKTERHLDFEVVNNGLADLAGYKGRPLNGIWATAPYLHNGSVPTIYDLFLPSCGDDDIAAGKACRPNKFTLGNREFDPVRIGFVQLTRADYPGLFEFDTGITGNSNAGHEYAVGVTPVIKQDADGKPVRDASGEFVKQWLPPISEVKRLALVEYLKTL